MEIFQAGKVGDAAVGVRHVAQAERHRHQLKAVVGERQPLRVCLDVADAPGGAAAALVPQMAERGGIVFMRTTREKTPVIYPPGEDFPIGGARVVRRTDDDAVTLIGAGITLHEALKDDPEVETASEGTEPHRYVVVLPRRSAD